MNLISHYAQRAVATAILMPGHLGCGTAEHYRSLADALAERGIDAVRYETPKRYSTVDVLEARTLTDDAAAAREAIRTARERPRPHVLIAHSTSASIMQAINADRYVGLYPVDLRRVSRERRAQFRKELEQPLLATKYGRSDRAIVEVPNAGQVLYSNTFFADFNRWIRRVDGYIRTAPTLVVHGKRDPFRHRRGWEHAENIDLPFGHHFRTDTEIGTIAEAVRMWIGRENLC